MLTLAFLLMMGTSQAAEGDESTRTERRRARVRLIELLRRDQADTQQPTGTQQPAVRAADAAPAADAVQQNRADTESPNDQAGGVAP